MIVRPNQLIDGQVSFERGEDSYQSPMRVPRNQLCLLVNSTTRQDYVGTRPGFTQGTLRFPDAPTQTAFETGYFQGFSAYRPDKGPTHLICSISGRIFRVDPFNAWQVQEIPVPETNPTNRIQAYFCQAECFLIIQDGQSKPIIYDGVKARRSDVNGTLGTDPDGNPLYEVPVGTVMAYANGRLWVVSAGVGQPLLETSFVAGDGVYGPTGTPQYNQRDAVLKFTENTYLSEGFAFAVPTEMGRITAMRALANLDTSLGQGPLQVFTTEGCFSVNAPFDRTVWKNLTNPIQTVSLLDQGAQSQAATQLVNGDAWYRSLDGVRSFFIARRDFGTWGNRSMSYEVIRHLKDDDRTLLRFGSAALFDNRLLVTSTPQKDAAHGVYHRGFVVLDFIPLNSILGPQPPCWDGLWMGLDTLQIQSTISEGVDYCFSFVLGAAVNGVRKIQVWQLTRDQGYDLNADNSKTRIVRRVEGPSLDWTPAGSNRLEQKLLEAAEFWVDKVRGTVDFTLSYRSDQSPCWIPWRSWQICSKQEQCAADAVDRCITNLNLKPDYRMRISAAMAPDQELSHERASRLGYTHQYALDITGDCELTAMRLLATRQLEATFGQTESAQATTCTETVCCEPSLFTP